MSQRRKIHTHTKILVFLNALPLEFQKQIHPSQIKRYQHINPSEYFGYELLDVVSREIEWIRQFGDFPSAKKLSVAILKLFIFFRSAVVKCRGFKKTIRREKFFL
jgi:hypothetical protein